MEPRSSPSLARQMLGLMVVGMTPSLLALLILILGGSPLAAAVPLISATALVSTLCVLIGGVPTIVVLNWRKAARLGTYVIAGFVTGVLLSGAALIVGARQGLELGPWDFHLRNTLVWGAVCASLAVIDWLVVRPDIAAARGARGDGAA